MAGELLPEFVSSRLTTSWLGRPYFFEQEVDSTSSRIAAWAGQGGAHGTVLAADTQTAGRGRLDRDWHSPAGTNLYFSALLRPSWPAPRTPLLSLAAGVALAEAVEPLLPAAPALKWPNDLLYEGRKLAGILSEAAAKQGACQHVILGIGLNVNARTFPSPLAERASSVALASGRPHDRGEILAAVLKKLEDWIDRLEAGQGDGVIAAWQRYTPWMGTRLVVRSGSQLRSGIALGLTTDGALRMRDEQGREFLVHAGDVEHPA